jgi:L-ribulose-5-phosphate 3-epimerase UlaE
MTYQKQAVKTINQFVEECDGNWHDAKVAMDNWCVEVMALGLIESVDQWRVFLHALDDAWMAMRPEGMEPDTP